MVPSVEESGTVATIKRLREFGKQPRRDLGSILVLDLSPGELLLFEGGGHVGVAEAGQMFDHHCVQLEV